MTEPLPTPSSFSAGSYRVLAAIDRIRTAALLSDLQGEQRDGELVIGPARSTDVGRIESLLEQAAPDCVPLSRHEILRHISSFDVVRDQANQVVGMVSMRCLDAHRAELRSLAVDPRFRGFGLGKRLAERVIVRSRIAGLELVCVTKRPGFFTSLGFKKIPLERIPEKPFYSNNVFLPKQEKHREDTVSMKMADGDLARVAMVWRNSPRKTEDRRRPKPRVTSTAARWVRLSDEQSGRKRYVG